MMCNYLTKEIVRYPMLCSRQLLEAFYLIADIVQGVIDLYEPVVHLPVHITSYHQHGCNYCAHPAMRAQTTTGPFTPDRLQNKNPSFLAANFCADKH